MLSPLMNPIILLLMMRGEGSERLPNGDDDHHPITECSGVQWLDGLGGQV